MSASGTLRPAEQGFVFSIRSFGIRGLKKPGMVFCFGCKSCLAGYTFIPDLHDFGEKTLLGLHARSHLASS